MNRVYLAGPISRGSLADNVNRATEAFVALAKAGLAPFAPQWSVYSKMCMSCDIPDETGNGCDIEDDDRCLCVGTKNGNDQMSHADWLNVDLPWVAVSNAVLRLPGESAGADREVEHARNLGIPVYHSVREVIDALSVLEVA